MPARLALPSRRPVRRIAAERVDVAVVLAADASGSVAQDRLALQVEGHARAIESEAVLAAVRAGALGRIALTFVAWTGADRQHQLVEWTLVGDAAAARGFAAALRRAQSPMPGYTSISGAIDFGARLLHGSGFTPARRVIDICGNGVNNDGRPAAQARDDAVAAGITVNGLPILDVDQELDAYYASQVVGGPGAFTVVARDLGSFASAILRKLLSEIAQAPASVLPPKFAILHGGRRGQAGH